MNSIEKGFLTLPLTEAARRTSEQFAKEQPTPQKEEQVRLNTLAVCVVNEYLQLMGIPTNLTAGDSWNPIVRMCADVADLEIIDVGRLECRPLTCFSPTCPIPPEVGSERIGYVVVLLSESLREATLLGFSPRTATEELPLTQLQAPEDLLTHLHQLKESVAASPSVAARRTAVNLSRWLDRVFDKGWQAVETRLSSEEPSLAFSLRSFDPSEAADLDRPETPIKRVKLIDLGMQDDRSVGLFVELGPQVDLLINICLKVLPTGDRRYLPPDLQLMVLDESGAVFLSAQSRSADNYLQLQFRGEPGDEFSVKVALGDVSITENFTF